MQSIPPAPKYRLKEVASVITDGIWAGSYCDLLCEQVGVICEGNAEAPEKLGCVWAVAQSHGWTAELLYGLELVRFRAKIWNLTRV